jgi:ribonuclease kappa
MKLCGPKLSLCGLIISVWGIIQLVSDYFRDLKN